MASQEVNVPVVAATTDVTPVNADPQGDPPKNEVNTTKS